MRVTAWNVHAPKPDDMKVMVYQIGVGLWIEGEKNVEKKKNNNLLLYIAESQNILSTLYTGTILAKQSFIL